MVKQKSDAGIEERLDTVIRLLAASLTKGATKKEAILMLADLKLTPAAIAEILGTSSNHVSVTIYAERKKPRNPSRRTKKPV